MIESRCGIVCSECAHKEPMGCGGCIAISKPFWGDQCPIKSCCEQKALPHCGECSEFPCDIAVKFSYDAENGDNGKRIEQCKKWAQMA